MLGLRSKTPALQGPSQGRLGVVGVGPSAPLTRALSGLMHGHWGRLLSRPAYSGVPDHPPHPGIWGSHPPGAGGSTATASVKDSHVGV